MQIVIAIAILGGLGLVFGLVLAAASKIFYVESDPRLDQLNECLPGANCGGCGYAGCGLTPKPSSRVKRPSGSAPPAATKLRRPWRPSWASRRKPSPVMVALVRCSGEKIYDADGNLTKGAKIKGNYEGLKDCLAASKIGGNGPVSCKFGCLGYGTCVKACKYGAMKVVNGVAHVDEDLCVGCMALCQRMPPSSDRPRGARSERGHRLCVSGQGRCHHPRLYRGLHRLRPVQEGLPQGRHYCGKESCPHRLLQVRQLRPVRTVCPKKLIRDSNVENLGEPKPVVQQT